MKTDIKVYEIYVVNKDSRASLICITSRISFSGPHYSAEFIQPISTFDNSIFKIPIGGYYNFQEELRLFSIAFAITPENRKNIEDWIKTKMKEAYGEDSEVAVKEFPTK